jgi:transcriptional regulator with XRE-family HTH domain
MAKDICVLLGKRIRKLRQARGWRQIDLAEQAGINENYVSDLELGNKEICLRTLKAVALALELTIGDLMKDVD